MLVSIAGFDGYFADTEQGRVYKVTSKGIEEVKYSYRKDGYVLVSVDRKPKLLHRLIYIARYGSVPKGKIISHVNDVKHDCKISNLEATDHKGNAARAKQNGLTPLGEKHYKAKLTEGDVIRILSLLQQGNSQSSIARKFGVKQGCINKMAHGKNWRHVQLPPQLREVA